MTKEFNPIDKKSLIIYSLILVAVIVVSAIVINPKKKSAPIVTTSKTAQEEPVDLGPGTTEASGYKIRGGWQVHKNDIFDINYPNGFSPAGDTAGALVSFAAADGRKLTVFAPIVAGDLPADFVPNESIETITSSVSGKNPTCNSVICSREIMVLEAKDKSYTKRILVSRNISERVTTAFAFQYRPDTPEAQVTDIFNYFQESLARHAK